MRFFWLMVIITVIVIYLNSVYFKGLEVVILLFITDFMVLWIYLEMERDNVEKSFLLEKIENLEKLTSSMFDKIAKRFSNEKNDKKDLIEALNNF